LLVLTLVRQRDGVTSWLRESHNDIFGLRHSFVAATAVSGAVSLGQAGTNKIIAIYGAVFQPAVKTEDLRRTITGLKGGCSSERDFALLPLKTRRLYYFNCLQHSVIRGIDNGSSLDNHNRRRRLGTVIYVPLKDNSGEQQLLPAPRVL
jgi:hypothetical protein